MEEQQIIDHIGTKKIRHRKKQLYNSIRSQMEFYFSDSNLTKDRFIGQLVRDDPFIDLNVFLKFNKVRNLTTKIEDICKALRKSELLELSEDNLKVRRKTAVNVKENEDDCTIYVERLPVDAEHDWLKNIFSKFGSVDYVSIPKYKHNRMIKGFAFVEFTSADSVKKVLDYFESIGCKLPTTMLPDNLVSIVTFEKEAAHTTRNKNKEADVETKPPEASSQQQTNETEEEKPTKKRKATNDDENTDTKKKKIDDEETTEETEKDDTKSEAITESKKNRNKSRRSHALDLQQIGLQILSKKEWKQLRNKYLNLQKQKMKNLKDQFHRNRFSNNAYNADTQVDKSTEDQKKVESAPRFKYTPGTIVSFQLSDSCMDVKKFKSEMRTQPGMEYIDIQPGYQNGYFRFTDNESAKKFCESETFNGATEILEGDVEKDYWDKIMEFRELKFKKEGKKQRGRDKLLRKAEKELGKHIKFDD